MSILSTAAGATPPWVRALPYLIAAAVLAGLLWWFGHARYTAGVEAGRQAVLVAEQQCQAGSLCAAAAEARSRDQARVVAEVQGKAAERARAAQEAAQKEIDSARAEGRARAAAAAREAQRADQAYQRALRDDASCRVWAEQVVPCPLTGPEFQKDVSK